MVRGVALSLSGKPFFFPQILESVIACLKLEVMWAVHDLLEDPSPTKVSCQDTTTCRVTTSLNSPFPHPGSYKGCACEEAALVQAL